MKYLLLRIFPLILCAVVFCSCNPRNRIDFGIVELDGGVPKNLKISIPKVEHGNAWHLWFSKRERKRNFDFQSEKMDVEVSIRNDGLRSIFFRIAKEMNVAEIPPGQSMTIFEGPLDVLLGSGRYVADDFQIASSLNARADMTIVFAPRFSQRVEFCFFAARTNEGL